MLEEQIILLNRNWRDFITLMDKSQDVFWMTNQDYSTQLYVSQAFEQIWGYSAKILYKRPLAWLDAILEEDKLRLGSISRLPHSCVNEYYLETYRIARANGEIRWIQDYTYPILNQMGECIGYFGIAKDITSTLELERELEIANKFLPKLAEKMEHTAFWVRDPSLINQLYLSKGFEKIWGRSINYLYEHPEKWEETVHPDDRQRDMGSMLSAWNSKGSNAKFSDFYRILRPDGEVRWIRDISFPIYDNNTEKCIGFAGIAEDVTQEKLYEIALQKAKDEAEAGNIAKSNFIASISHDFRTPLNGLLGMAEILRSRPCYPEQKEYIDAILQAGNSLLDFVEDVINFVALDLNKLPINEEFFNLEKLIEEIILTISPQAHQKKVEIILSYGETVPKEVYGDINRIRRILMNLMNNAVKFTNKGHMLVSVELQKQFTKKFWLQFMIEDTGIGIPSENFDYIFGSFNRLDPSYRGRYKGTGLGLTIVKQFVEDLGGKVKVTSRVNHGSIFSFKLPFRRAEKGPTADMVDHYSYARTLIVDDYKKRAVTFIKQFGFKNADIASSKTVHELVKEAAQADEPYELVLIDDEINWDIQELAEKIRENGSGVLILFSDKNSNRTLQELKKMGYLDFITKPLQPLVVIKILENAVVANDVTLQEEASIEQNSLRVLLVEDDILTQKITSLMLEEFNCKVEIASNGGKALELIHKPFDLILMDVGLPDMDGIQLAEKIRNMKSRHLFTPIVALTAHVLERDKEKCLAAGMNGFLKKPLFKKDLKKILLKSSRNKL